MVDIENQTLITQVAKDAFAVDDTTRTKDFRVETGIKNLDFRFYQLGQSCTGLGMATDGVLDDKMEGRCAELFEKHAAGYFGIDRESLPIHDATKSYIIHPSDNAKEIELQRKVAIRFVLCIEDDPKRGVLLSAFSQLLEAAEIIT